MKYQHNSEIRQGHANQEFTKLKVRLGVSIILAAAILLYSPSATGPVSQILSTLLPIGDWVLLVCGTVLFVYGGLPIFQGAKAELTARAPGLMTFILTVITVAYAYSLTVTLMMNGGTNFWWQLAFLVIALNFARWLESASVGSTQSQEVLKELAGLLPRNASLSRPTGTKQVSVSALQAGDMVLVPPKSNIPVDGTVVEGASEVDESMLTGESKPVEKIFKDQVIAGTANGSGTLLVLATKTGDDTQLAEIMRHVSGTQKSKRIKHTLAWTVTSYVAVFALIAANSTLLSWTFFSDKPIGFILEHVVLVLIFACPPVLALAVPLVMTVSERMVIKSGLLLRQRMALEAARQLDVVVFGKTGTLTKGEQGILAVVAIDNDMETVLSLAASVDAESEHPVAKAIVNSAKEKGLLVKKARYFVILPGRGAEARVGDKAVFVGGSRLLIDLGLSVPKVLQSAVNEAGRDGKTVVYVIEEADVKGIIVLGDIIRQESKETLLMLRQLGIKVSMLTGDSKEVASAVANELGIDKYYAEMLPDDKAQFIRKLQAEGNCVAMVGEGLNDTPALVQADIGIAVGGGADATINSASIVLLRSDLRDIVRLIKFSSAVNRKVMQNLGLAIISITLVLPLATGLAEEHDYLLFSAVGAASMVLPVIIAALNARLLKRTVV